MKQLHPDWEIEVYNDMDCRAVIELHLPSLLEVYDAYKFPIQRADIFRVVVVFLFGGFYMDLDVQCFKKLDDLCFLQMVLGEEKTLSDEERNRLQLTHNLRVANYMFGSIPGHPFWIDFLRAAAANSATQIQNENDILETTGPGLLTSVYHEVKGSYNDIFLLKNRDKKCIKNCRKASCHFGDYAAHLHIGSWRWQHTNKVRPIH